MIKRRRPRRVLRGNFLYLHGLTLEGGGQPDGSSPHGISYPGISDDLGGEHADKGNKRHQPSTTAPSDVDDHTPKFIAGPGQKLAKVAETPKDRFDDGNRDRPPIIVVDDNSEENWEVWEPDDLGFGAPLTFVPREVTPSVTLLESVKALMETSQRVMPRSLPNDEKILVVTALTICRCALKFVRADSKNEVLLCSTFMAVTGQKYRSHVDGLYRYGDAGAFVLVKTIAAEDVAFLHASLRLAECIMQSMPGNMDRKDDLSLSEVGKIVSSSDFETSSFVDKVLASVGAPSRNAGKNWKTDFVTLLVSIRGDLCSAAGLRGAIQSYHRWGESPLLQGGGVVLR